jgi:neutral ceramidase
MRASAGLLLVCLTGCGAPKQWEEKAALSPRPGPATGTLRAGFGRTDITPPIGVGLAGNGPEGNRAMGYRMRLLARALVLEQANGDRLALVVADLPHVSPLLQRRVASQTRDLGIGVDRLMLSATHTHASVGHMYEAEAYNQKSSIVPGFDSEILDSISSRIARAIRSAVFDLAPARIGWGSRPVWGQTRIRSLPAMLRNVPRPRPVMAPPPETPLEYALVDPMLTILRVDRWDSSRRAFRPAGAWTAFAMHATGNTPNNDLLDADLPGMISQSVEHYIDAELIGDSTASPATYLMASTAAGDVSPDWPAQSRCTPPRLLPQASPTGPFARSLWSWIPPDVAELAMCRHAARRAMIGIAGAISAVADSLFHDLEDSLQDSVSLERSFVTLPLTERADSLGICDAPIPGMSTFGGAPDARTRFYGWRWLGFIESGMEEGSHSARSPHGCQGQKRFLLWAGATKRLIGKTLPATAQLILIRIGSHLLAGVPFETTTMAGRQIKDSIVAAVGLPAGQQNVLVVSLTNGFLEYATTADEYSIQYYEGGSTLYGPGSSTMLARALGELARTLTAGDSLPTGTAPGIKVIPGKSRHPFAIQGDRFAGVDRAWCSGDTLYARLGLGRAGGWLVRDSADAQTLLEIRGTAGTAGDSLLATDNDPNVELHFMARDSRTPWELRWAPALTGRYTVTVKGSGAASTAQCEATKSVSRR